MGPHLTRVGRRATLANVGAAAALTGLLTACAAALAPVAARADARPPVVLVVLDELPTTTLLGRDGRIDADHFPNLASLAREATWFPNATTVHDKTSQSLPAILDGKAVANRVPATTTGHPQTLLTLFSRRLGYDVRASMEATAICPRSICGPRRSARYYLARARFRRFDRFIAGITPSPRPTFYFKQSLLPHVPWIYLPSGRQYQRGPRALIPNLSKARLTSHDPFLLKLAYQRHHLQTAAVDLLVGRLVRRLKETGLYDRALLVLTADHGISFRRGEKDRRVMTYPRAVEVGSVPLFVKRPGQRRGRIDRTWARTYDVPATIADVLGFRIPWRTRGRSAFSRAVRRRRSVRMASRVPGLVVRLSEAAFRRRRQRVIRRNVSWLGGGARGSRMYALGPHPELVGRPLAAVPVASGGRVLARLAGAGELREVRLASQFVPAFVVGRIHGGRRGSTRALAVSMNGRIEAVVRSFRLGGRGPETFAALVPEGALREGRNEVSVLSMERRRGRFRLRVVGGT